VLPGKSAQGKIASTVAANPAGNLLACVATMSGQLEKPQCKALSLAQNPHFQLKMRPDSSLTP
jgi:hypothetical protein